MKKLFLCHHSADAEEMARLAHALRLRGVVPWVDKDGGFGIADHCPSEARRAIREDCLGFLFLATEEAIERPFIRDIEIPAAIKARESDPSFLLFAVPHGISFERLRELSLRHFQHDLSQYHSGSSSSAKSIPSSIANEVLAKVLLQVKETAALSIQLSTRQLMPIGGVDALCIDAVRSFADGSWGTEEWSELWVALRDVERAVASTKGRPRIQLHGSKHLTSAFMFGRAFARYVIDIRQTADAVWSSDEPEDTSCCFSQRYTPGKGESLFVSIATGRKNVARDMEAQLIGGGDPSVLHLRPRSDPPSVLTSGGQCRALARHAYAEIEFALQNHRIEELHLCAAAPITLMVMLGQRFSGTPPVLLYEWAATRYRNSWVEVA